jgi:hypothetical protein
MKNYTVKITNWTKQKKVEIQYPPSPTCYYYCLNDSKQELNDKLLNIMRDSKNANIEIIDK